MSLPNTIDYKWTQIDGQDYGSGKPSTPYKFLPSAIQAGKMPAAGDVIKLTIGQSKDYGPIKRFNLGDTMTWEEIPPSAQSAATLHDLLTTLWATKNPKYPAKYYDVEHMSDDERCNKALLLFEYWGNTDYHFSVAQSGSFDWSVLDRSKTKSFLKVLPTSATAHLKGQPPGPLTRIKYVPVLKATTTTITAKPGAEAQKVVPPDPVLSLLDADIAEIRFMTQRILDLLKQSAAAMKERVHMAKKTGHERAPRRRGAVSGIPGLFHGSLPVEEEVMAAVNEESTALALRSGRLPEAMARYLASSTSLSHHIEDPSGGDLGDRLVEGGAVTVAMLFGIAVTLTAWGWVVPGVIVLIFLSGLVLVGALMMVLSLLLSFVLINHPDVLVPSRWLLKRRVRRDLAAGRVVSAKATVRLDHGELRSHVGGRRLLMTSWTAARLRRAFVPHVAYFLPRSRVVVWVEPLWPESSEYRSSPEEARTAVADPSVLRAELARAHGFKVAWLDANRQGSFAASQRWMILRRRLTGVAVAALVLADLLRIPWTLYGGSPPAWWFVALVCVVGIWGWFALRRARSVRREWSDGVVLSAAGWLEGRSTHEPRTAPVWWYCLGELKFRVTRDQAKLVIPGVEYRVYFTPQSRILVGVEPVANSSSPALRQAETSPPHPRRSSVSAPEPVGRGHKEDQA